MKNAEGNIAAPKIIEKNSYASLTRFMQEYKNEIRTLLGHSVTIENRLAKVNDNLKNLRTKNSVLNERICRLSERLIKIKTIFEKAPSKHRYADKKINKKRQQSQ